MPDAILKDRLELILDSIKVIESGLRKIKTADMEEKLLFTDSLAIRLQQIGENVKKINLIDKDFFEVKLGLDVNQIIRFRDFISHHYEKTDFEIILDICENHIPLLKKKINEVLK
jgi:uncharacterized protein with HEPN domain